MRLFIVGLICAIVTSIAADARGRSGPAWFFLSLFLPVLSLLFLVVLPNKRPMAQPPPP
jgi:hypothetical protein